MSSVKTTLTISLGLSMSLLALSPAEAARRCEAAHAIVTRPSEAPLATASAKGFLNPGAKVEADGHVTLHLTQKNSLTGKLVNALGRGLLQPALKTKRLDDVLGRLQQKLKENSDQTYFSKVLESFGIQSRFNVKMLEEVPTKGGVIVTLNHPLSGLELIAVAEALSPVRRDVKIVSTTFLESVPGFKDHAIFVNNMGGAEARAHNVAQREAIAQYLKDGHVIVIAPAGAVSVKENMTDAHAMDPVWKTGVADFLAQAPETQVLPVFVSGGPSQTFHRMQRVHPFAGTSMIIREIGDLIGKSIEFAIGAPIKPAEIAKFTDRRDLMKYLRLRTYIMSHAIPKTEQQLAAPKRVRSEPVAEPIDPTILKNEIEGLRVLHDLAPDNAAKGMKALIAYGRDIPNVLNEIGRLRELNFWEAGEGTGRARDLDKYDLDYNHLIVWDKKQNRIAGAYRVGFVDNILREKGPEGLYTGLFFGIAPLLPSKLSQMFEIGRSFVDKDYQGRSFALPTLFGGLARILAYEGNYRGFFGAVSVSNEFTPVSKALILKWAARYAGDKDYGTVKVKTPPRFETRLSEAELDYMIEKAPTVQELNQLIEAAEGRPGARTPQLIPIYVELGARFLGFDHDPAFNTVDGLILADIRELPHATRVKYMQEEGARVFEQKWGLEGR